MLSNWQREAVQSIIAGGANNNFFNEGFNFLRINLFQLRVEFLSWFQCEIKLLHQTVHFL